MIRRLSFQDIPGFPKLFLDFIYNFDAVQSFYSGCSMSVANVARCVKDVLDRRYPRREVAEVLAEQNAQLGSSAETLNNIEKLKSENVVAVITGQQVGLFAGPLLTIYKALTAIKLADYLKGEGISAVPVFWMASEDHDFIEVAKTYLVNLEGKLVAIEYPKDESQDRRSVGEILISAQISEMTAQLEAMLPRSEFSDSILEAVKSSYHPGETFASAFGRLLAHILSRYGLIIIDPSDGRLKSLTRPLYAKALCGARAINRIILERNRQLEAVGYQLQVKQQPTHTLIFCTRDSQRMPLEMRGESLAVGDLELRCEELLSLLEREPDRFTPNVLFRPLVQDFLMPTAAYVGGPSEICYYAQAQPLYRYFGQVEPSIVPRASFTIVEQKTQRVFAKYQLTTEDFFADLESLLKKAVERALAGDRMRLFDEAERALSAELDKLERAIGEVDATLIRALHNAREKMIYQLSKLRTKFVHSYARQNQIARNQIERSWNLIYPRKTLQERVLNPCYFLARYGTRFIDTIYETIDLNSRDHNILELS